MAPCLFVNLLRLQFFSEKIARLPDITSVPCLQEAELMNYVLGRDDALEHRLHIAKCPKCRKTMARLDQELMRESLEIQKQSAGFRPPTVEGKISHG